MSSSLHDIIGKSHAGRVRAHSRATTIRGHTQGCARKFALLRHHVGSRKAAHLDVSPYVVRAARARDHVWQVRKCLEIRIKAARKGFTCSRCSARLVRGLVAKSGWRALHLSL